MTYTREPFEPTTTNRGLTLTFQEVEGLKAMLNTILHAAEVSDQMPPAYVRSLSDKVALL